MANEVKPNKEEMAAFERIEKTLSGPKGKTAVGALDTGNVCEIYHKIRDEILLVIKFLKKLPFSWAKRVVEILELLMGIADKFCAA